MHLSLQWTALLCIKGKPHTWARLQKASCAAFLFSDLPSHAARAEACRALPYEKVSFQGLGRGDWFMAFRLREASSSLWPPDRKQIPERQRPQDLEIVCSSCHSYWLWQRSQCIRCRSKSSKTKTFFLCVCFFFTIGTNQQSPGTAAGTVRRRVVTVATATSWGVYFLGQECPAVTMLGFSSVPSR